MTLDFGTDIARRVNKAEHALDRTIAEIHDLAATMTRGRISNRLAASVGQNALAEVTLLCADLSAARERLIAAHRALLGEAERMGIPWHAAGPELKPEEDRPARPAHALKAAA